MASWCSIYCATALGIAVLAAACGHDVHPTEPVTTKTTGAIKVIVSMTGVDLPALYSVGGAFGTVFAYRGADALLTQVAPGTQRVELRLPPNCQVDGENPQSVTVAAGQIATLSFAATCVSTTGSARVTAPTTGVEPDADGYLVTATGVDQMGVSYQRTERVPVSGALVLTVPVGTTKLALRGIALNCVGADLNERPVTIRPSDTASVIFPVECGPKAQLAFVSPTANGDIAVVFEDGSGVRRLTTEPSLEADPAWSPDGRALAFTSDRAGNLEIYTMNADGSGVTRLTTDTAADYEPAWSPDGRRIAFASTRSGDAEIYVMNADGTNPVRLTNSPGNDFAPAWSPDGRRIAFTTTRESGARVYAMNVDGTGVTRLVADEGKYPAWSPDGSGLAYSGPSCSDYYYYICYPAVIFIQAASSFGGPGERPSWSPDGRKIAFNGFDCTYSGGTTNVCTAGPVRVGRLDSPDVVSLIAGSSAVWRPK
jgi:TolB protein